MKLTHNSTRQVNNPNLEVKHNLKTLKPSKDNKRGNIQRSSTVGAGNTSQEHEISETVNKQSTETR